MKPDALLDDGAAASALAKNPEAELRKYKEKLKTVDALNARIKLLMKDRRAFLKFCRLVKVKDPELIFEAAMAKEIPIEVDEIAQPQVVEAIRAREEFGDFIQLVLGIEVDRIDMRQLKSLWMSRREGFDSKVEDATPLGFTVHEQLREQTERIELLESEIEKLKQIEPIVIIPPETKNVSTLTETVAVFSNGTQTIPFAAPEPSIVPPAIPAISDEEITELKKRVRELDRVIARNAQLEAERNRYLFIEEMASKQADRDIEIRQLRSEIDRLENKSSWSSSQEMINHVFIKMLSYSIANDYDKMKSLIPITRQLFNLSAEDVGELEKLCAGSAGDSWFSNFPKVV
jgi:hypothetical protein